MITNEKSISTTHYIRRFITDLVFPISCIGCKKLSQDNICDSCLETINFQNGFACAFCSSGVVNGLTCPFDRQEHMLSQLLVALSYDDPLVKKSIKAFKYNFIKDLGDQLADLSVEYLDKQIDRNILNLDNLIIVPIPLTKSRLRWRGYNQADIVANKIGSVFNLQIDNSTLIRNKDAEHQAEIKNRELRMANIKDCFKCINPQAIEGKNILLVDDISTTGSTLEECARVLKKAGANRISAFVLARAI